MLDAACGTGKYFAMVTDGGRRVVGTDQSTGMLGRARARFPAVPLERLGLRELDRELADATARGLPAVRGECPATATATCTCWSPAPAGSPARPIDQVRRSGRRGGSLSMRVVLIETRGGGNLQ